MGPIAVQRTRPLWSPWQECWTVLRLWTLQFCWHTSVPIWATVVFLHCEWKSSGLWLMRKQGPGPQRKAYSGKLWRILQRICSVSAPAPCIVSTKEFCACDMQTHTSTQCYAMYTHQDNVFTQYHCGSGSKFLISWEIQGVQDEWQVSIPVVSQALAVQVFSTIK